MSATFVYEGEQRILDLYISTETQANIIVALHTANAGSGQNTSLGQLTEATFSGYAHAATTWAAGAIDSNGKWARAGNTVTFTHNGGGTANTVTGYHVYESTTNKLLFYEEFSAPISMSASGNAISVTPTAYCGPATTPL